MIKKILKYTIDVVAVIMLIIQVTQNNGLLLPYFAEIDLFCKIVVGVCSICLLGQKTIKNYVGIDSSND